MLQDSILCGCGAPAVGRNGMCARCGRRARLSLECFGGLREECLQRDGYQCRLCGELDPGTLLVHHRRRGVNRLDRLITLCRACHVRIHRTWRPGWWLTSFGLFRKLWREMNRDLAEQRLLRFLEDHEREGEKQARLFEIPRDGC